MATTAEEVAAVLVAHSPRIQATRVLSLLASRTGAGGAVLLTTAGERLAIFATAGDLAPDRLAQACSGWEWHRDTLEGAKTVQSGPLVLVPVKEGSDLLGFVYLDGASEKQLSALDEFTLPLAQSIRAAARKSIPAAPSPATSHKEKPRETLVRALDENEWNVARVARLLGVTRRTIYLRMEKYAIARQKVPKTLKA